MPLSDEILKRLASAHQEALRVGDSPLRADQLAPKLAELSRDVAEHVDASEEMRSRVRGAIADAERCLRRDDDGREAARHIQTAQRNAEERTRRPPPF